MLIKYLIAMMRPSFFLFALCSCAFFACKPNNPSLPSEGNVSRPDSVLMYDISNNDEKLVMTSFYSYDAMGNAICIIDKSILSTGQQLTRKSEMTYNEENKLRTIIIDDQSHIKKGVYFWTDTRHATCICYRYHDGEPEYWETCEKVEYLYNLAGNVERAVYYWHFNRSDSTWEENAEYAEYEYDKYGNLILHKLVNESGNTLSVDYYCYEYNDAGIIQNKWRYLINNNEKEFIEKYLYCY